jgi:hypothetical protein
MDRLIAIGEAIKILGVLITMLRIWKNEKTSDREGIK